MDPIFEGRTSLEALPKAESVCFAVALPYLEYSPLESEHLEHSSKTEVAAQLSVVA